MEGAVLTIVGHEVSPATDWNPNREESLWIGKPWRRIELLTRRTYWKGEQVDVGRDLTIHIGNRRLGFGVTLIVMRQRGFDYSDEPHQ